MPVNQQQTLSMRRPSSSVFVFVVVIYLLLLWFVALLPPLCNQLNLFTRSLFLCSLVFTDDLLLLCAASPDWRSDWKNWLWLWFALSHWFVPWFSLFVLAALLAFARSALARRIVLVCWFESNCSQSVGECSSIVPEDSRWTSLLHCVLRRQWTESRWYIETTSLFLCFSPCPASHCFCFVWPLSHSSHSRMSVFMLSMRTQ